MRIGIELPDWVEERNVYIFAGIEQVARKLKGQPLEVKIARCGLCGKCCGNCKDLEERQGYKQPNNKWAVMCKLSEARPFNCCTSDGVGMVKECFIEWEKVEQP